MPSNGMAKLITLLNNFQQNLFIIAVVSLSTMNTKALGLKVFEDRSSLKQLMSTNNPYFNERMKQIMNKNFEEIKRAGIFEKRNLPTSNLFYFHANLYDSSQNEQLQDLILQEVEHFYSNFKGTFALVYVHSSFTDFLAFRKMIQKWPEHFFYRLRRIYILTPSVMVKFISTFSLGTFYRLCDELFLNVDSEQDLQTHDEQILRGLGQTKTPQKSAISKPIKIIQSSIYGKQLDQYDLMSGRYPQILLELFSRLLRDPLELRRQGIFRKSCDSEQLQRLEKQIEMKQKEAIWNQADILVVCGCLKKIMNNLRLPLFNYNIYQKVINFQTGEEIPFIKSIFQQMEYVNKKVFILLTVFLVDYIVGQQQHNKMSGYNLAVVFAPCFFRPKEYDLKDLIYSGKFAKILVTTFDKYREMIEQSEIDLARGTLQELRTNPIKL